MLLRYSLTAFNGSSLLMVIFNTCYPSKGKYVPVHAVKSYRGMKGIVLLILNLDTGWLVTDNSVFCHRGLK